MYDFQLILRLAQKIVRFTNFFALTVKIKPKSFIG